MKKLKISCFWILFISLFITQIGFAQFDIPPKPSFQTSVYDYANVLQANEKSQLEEKLIRYSDSTSTQIVVITIESLKGEDIGILTPKWGQTWGIGGSEQNDNGIIILLAKVEHKIWIAPGYGVEDRLTAGINGQLIRNVIIPEFKTGNYYNGLDKGTDAVFQVLKGEYKGERKNDLQSRDYSRFFPILIFIIFIIISIIGRRNGGNGGSGGIGSTLLNAIILSNLGRSSGGGSFGGGSSGGGGFGGGFGGGGFSGGGAGGSW